MFKSLLINAIDLFLPVIVDETHNYLDSSLAKSMPPQIESIYTTLVAMPPLIYTRTYGLMLPWLDVVNDAIENIPALD